MGLEHMEIVCSVIITKNDKGFASLAIIWVLSTWQGRVSGKEIVHQNIGL
jgi:hypothetical protein